MKRTNSEHSADVNCARRRGGCGGARRADQRPNWQSPDSSWLQLRERGEDFCAVVLALFRVELDTEDIAVGDDRRDRAAIVGRRNNVLRVDRLQGEAVHEIA